MIKLIWKLILICIALAVVCYGIAFSYYNSQELSIDLVFGQLPSAPSGLIVLASLLIGFCLAFLLFSFSIGKLRIKNSILRKKVDKIRQENMEIAKIPTIKTSDNKNLTV